MAEPEFKLVLVGDSGVGKSAWLKRHMTDEFEKRYIPTQCLEVHKVRFTTNMGPITFNVWDCSGQTTSTPEFQQTIDGADCAIVMFDVTSRSSYKNVPNWYDDLKGQNLTWCKEHTRVADDEEEEVDLDYVDHNGKKFFVKKFVDNPEARKYHRSLPHICLVGNKADRQDRTVKAHTIKFHRQKNLQYYDVSAKSKYNYEKPFLWLARRLSNEANLEFVGAPDPVPEFKLVLIGDGGVGKTTFVKRLMTGEFEERYEPTNCVSVCPLRFDFNMGPMKFNVWDTAGQRKFWGLADGYYIQGQCAIIMFDITDRGSFNRVKEWHRAFTRVCGDSVPILLVGNKMDGKDSKVDVRKIDRLGLPYVEVNAKSGENCEYAVLKMARLILSGSGSSRETNEEWGEDLQFVEGTGERGAAAGGASARTTVPPPIISKALPSFGPPFSIAVNQVLDKDVSRGPLVVGLSFAALSVIDSFLIGVRNELAALSFRELAAKPGDPKQLPPSLSEAHILNATRALFKGELASHAVREATKSTTKFASSDPPAMKGGESRHSELTQRAGLVFSVDGMHQYLQSGGSAQLEAGVCLAAILEYLCTEALEVAGKLELADNPTSKDESDEEDDEDEEEDEEGLSVELVQRTIKVKHVTAALKKYEGLDYDFSATGVAQEADEEDDDDLL